MSTRCSNQNLLSLGETSPHVSHAFTSGARSTLTRIIKRYCAANAISRVNVDHMISSTTSTDFSAAVSSSRRTLLLGAITSFEIINTIGLCSTHHANAASGLVMPNLEAQVAINAALRKVMSKGKAPSALRLVFHDAGTFNLVKRDGGMNASIQFELERPENFGLKRGWRIILDLEKAVKDTPAEGLVSRTDWIAIAGAAAVAVCGGPAIAVAIGRKDASGPDPEGRLPAESLSASELKSNFASKGFSVREMVALSGAHTIGGKGFGAPDVFDNAYFKSLLARPWLDKKDPMATMIGLPSDHVLPDDDECLPFIKEFSSSEDAFFEAFSSAYLKMTSSGITV